MLQKRDLIRRCLRAGRLALLAIPLIASLVLAGEQVGDPEKDPFAPGRTLPGKGNQETDPAKRATMPKEAERVADDPDKKKAYWEGYARRRTYLKFSEPAASLWDSMSQFSGGAEIHLVYDPRKWGFRISFVRDGKEILWFPGHRYTVFRKSKNVLYFAHYSYRHSGCSVGAYDLETGKTLWLTELKGLEYFSQFAYSNRVTLGVRDRERVVVAVGHESRGDYVEILDQHTGERLAHKAFLRKLPKVEPPGPFPDDRRLDAKVTYKYPEETDWRQLFKDLSTQGGITLSVAREVPAARIQSAERTESLRDAMRRWTRSPALKWIRDGDGYRLTWSRDSEKK